MSEVSILDILKDENLRLEAEFHTNKSIKIQGAKGSEIIDFVQYGTSEELNEDSLGYPILRLNEFDGYFIGEPSKYCNKISEQTYQELRLKKGDVLICRTNGNPKYVGKSAVVMQDYDYAYASYLFRIRPNQIINSETLVSFLNSKYGRQEIERFSMQSNQSNFSPAKFREITIPIIENYIQKEIAVLFKNSFNDILLSKQKYAEAETLLLENLGLQNFQSTNQFVNIKTLKDSFLQTGRLDAEFYQPKYDELEKLFDRFERIKLADLVNYPISSGITPKANGDDYADKESGIAFIRAVDLQNGEVSLVNLNYIKPNIHETTLKRTELKQNDVLLSIAGTVGRCAIFTHNMPANINQAVAILRFDEIKVNRLYLVAFFNSELGKQFIAKYARQGLQTNLNLTEIGELSIPIPDMTIQIQIANYIRQSNELRGQAQSLLYQAKTSVELEIENISHQERRERERERESF